jgi:ribosomal protein S18 acetylase RimI-like enzyme
MTEVEAASAVDDALVDAVATLVPQLSRSAAAPTRDILEQIVSGSGSDLFVARHDGRIVGLLTLVWFQIPTGRRAIIEDVVVDEAVRGSGVGSALVKAALDRAEALGARTVDLTSRPHREAANRLYLRMGFAVRDTNVYRVTLDR